jgi:hypothetical protein
MAESTQLRINHHSLWVITPKLFQSISAINSKYLIGSAYFKIALRFNKFPCWSNERHQFFNQFVHSIW